ncbi:MAG: porin [Rickettsiales bacterium]
MSIQKLLLTSALVAGFAVNALASGPSVTLGGSLDTYINATSQKSAFKYNGFATQDASNKLNQSAVANDTNLHVNVAGKAGNGLKYGGKILLNADASANKYATASVDANGVVSYASSSQAIETMAYAETMFGRLEAGTTPGVYNSFKVNAANIARATGGIDGNSQYSWNPAITTSGGAYALVSNRFWVNPNLPSNYSTANSANAAKVSVVSPTWMGLKAGISYIPDMAQSGTVNGTHTVARLQDATGAAINPAAPYRNVISGGLHYAATMQKIGFKASLLGETGKAKNDTAGIQRHKLKAWELGAGVSYMGFALNGSFADMGDSGLTKAVTPGKKNTKYWTLGGAYEYGAAGLSVTYMTSTRGLLEGAGTKENKFSNLSIGLDYKLAPGFMPYAEVSAFKIDERAPANSATAGQMKNTGTVFLVGSKLVF